MSTNSTRRKTFELPKDEGLAEWTSKIKAMQRQVDADEEAEQKRLEEEIAASRLARQRRSRGFGYGGQISNQDQRESIHISLHGARTLTLVCEVRSNDRPTDKRTTEYNSDDPSSPTDRPKRQEEAFNKLADGSISSPTSTSLSTGKSPLAPPMKSKSPSLPIERKAPEPMSLAAFMGGRATGPRLNKHAPQQDAHDPTQFDQWTHKSAPHPVFGRGGIAMPGMASAPKTSPPADLSSGRLPDKVDKPSWSTPKRFSGAEKDTTPSSSPFLNHYTESLHAPSDAALPPGRRERTKSTPNRSELAHSPLPTWSQDDRGTRDAFRRPASYSPLPASTSKAAEITPKTTELRSKTSEGRLRTKSDLRPGTPENQAPRATIKSADTRREAIHDSPPVTSSFSPPYAVPVATRPSHKSPLNPPSLARPIQPDVRVSPQGPSIPTSQNPSPAFLRPPAQKDLTPSLSRLQGRGFVQSMVKVSSQIENMATGSPGSPTPSDKTRLSNAKRSSVLERWHATSMSPSVDSPTVVPKSQSTSTPVPVVRTVPSSMPSPSPPSPVLRREFTQPDFRKSLNPTLPISKADTPVHASKPLAIKQRKSFTEQMPPEGSPGLGSSSTLISYIKPLKTGDDPLVLPESTPSLDVDELGMRASSSGAKLNHSVAKPVTAGEQTAGKPLTHVRYPWK